MRQRSVLIVVLGLAAIVFLASGMGWFFGGFRSAGPMGWGMMGGQGPMMGRSPMMGGAPPALPQSSEAPAQEGIQVTLSPGGSQVIQFTPTESGRFPLLCTVPGHAPAGMRGDVTVL